MDGEYGSGPATASDERAASPTASAGANASDDNDADGLIDRPADPGCDVGATETGG
jgi:hypothetical protein